MPSSAPRNVRVLPVAEPYFQTVAVEYALTRLTDAKGTGRFLLADEVGLGKTHVARGIVLGLRNGRPGTRIRGNRRLRVAYVCSSQAILAQNRDRLGLGACTIGRITEVLLKGRRLAPLIALTPGISLMGGPGMAWERKLLFRVARERLGIGKTRAYRMWSEFFKGRRVRKSWVGEPPPLRRGVAKRLEREWCRKVPGGLSMEMDLLQTFDLWRRAGPHGAERDHANAERTRVIGRLRMSLQLDALKALRLGLVILDEVQRFRWIIDCLPGDGPAPHPAEPLARRLLTGGRKTLLLSATPWRTLSFDNVRQQSEFARTLRFLFGGSGAQVGEVERLLETFRARLDDIGLTGGDTELWTAKRQLERLLRPVMSRTERTRYGDGASGERSPVVTPVGDTEIEQYLRLRRYLISHEDASGCITDYWKSFPSPLTFMDRGYRSLRDLKSRGGDLPHHLVTRADRLGSLPDHHRRLRELHSLAFPGRPDRLPDLWVSPSYRYYQDDRCYGPLNGAADRPGKLLVFSAWRFVPKAISLTLSGEVERRLELNPVKPLSTRRVPLRLARKDERGLPLAMLDVCFPSPALGRLVQPWREGDPGRPPDVLVRSARERLVTSFRAVGVTIASPRDAATLTRWAAVMRLERGKEALHLDTRRIRKALRRLGSDPADEGAYGSWARPIGDLVSDLDRCRADSKPGTLSGKDLDLLTLCALFSPAVCIERALRSSGARARSDAGRRIDFDASMIALGLGPLRRWLNRTVAQTIVNAAVRKQSGPYAARVLAYCQYAHFPAAADEFAYMLCEGSEPPVQEWARALSVGSGLPHINTVNRQGITGTRAMRSHYAMALGEEHERVEDGASGPRTGGGGEDLPGTAAVCRAFNSPFWPFVLATTSVGQEGLDFHGYCRDIVHWNLPTSPVELEQREGRLTRRDGLAVRVAVAADSPLRRFTRNPLPSAVDNPFSRAFARLEDDPHHRDHLDGLHPHWIYEAPGHSEAQQHLRRHLIFFESSEDADRYEELRRETLLYRLVFGQPRQAELLNRLHRRHTGMRRKEIADLLPAHLLDLSPFHSRDPWRRAVSRAKDLLRTNALPRLVMDVDRLGVRRRAELLPVAREIEALKVAVTEWSRSMPSGKPTPGMIHAVAALVYLREPNDRIPDRIPREGLVDDQAIIRRAASLL